MTIETLVEHLSRLTGCQVLMAGGSHPVQAMLEHEDGWALYFRARGDAAELEVFSSPFPRDCGLPELPSEESVLCWSAFRGIDGADLFSTEYTRYVFTQLWRNVREHVHSWIYS